MRLLKGKMMPAFGKEGETSLAVANALLRLGNSRGMRISPMKLQKLVYFAHGWMLARHGRPLFEDCIYAWKHGPVVPPLYHEFKNWGGDPIKYEGGGAEPTDSAALKVIEEVLNVYGPYNGLQLSAMTHADGTPWDTTVREKGVGSAIPNEVIRDWFLQP